MELALNKLQGLICHKTQPINQPSQTIPPYRVSLEESRQDAIQYLLSSDECKYLLIFPNMSMRRGLEEKVSFFSSSG